MSKRTTKDGITTIKARGVTMRVNEREMDKMDAEEAAQQAKRDERSRVFNLLDTLSQAKRDLKGTVEIMSLLIGVDRNKAGVTDTLERWISADLEAVDRAFDAAWNGILKPLNPNQEGEQ